MIGIERVESLNAQAPKRGRYVLYWMQQAQRAEYNHALEFAIEKANIAGLPVVAGFGLTDDFPEANARHYAFMLEGLRDARDALRKRDILLVVRRGHPDRVAAELAEDAAFVVTDMGYLRIQRQWRRDAAKRMDIPLFQIESDVVLPVEIASSKEEYAARTIRPRINRILDRYLVAPPRAKVTHASLDLKLESLDLDDTNVLLSSLKIDRSVAPVATYRGGASAAAKLLRSFLKTKLDRYASDRNDPSLDFSSHMSPYLHFGQISPIQIALAVRDSGAAQKAIDAFLEELIVRRELSMNFVHFNRHYDSYECVPDWARRTLRNHAKDKRDHVYTRDQWEQAATHDPYWNAAQLEMVCTGKMHNYMRMYWGKKIIEWSGTPEEAFETTLYLNNKYELDGRDANSFAGVAWCFGKHDRPWTERPVFGQVRYMNAAGLKRKFRIDDYVRRVEELSGRGIA